MTTMDQGRGSSRHVVVVVVVHLQHSTVHALAKRPSVPSVPKMQVGGLASLALSGVAKGDGEARYRLFTSLHPWLSESGKKKENSTPLPKNKAKSGNGILCHGRKIKLVKNIFFRDHKTHKLVISISKC